MKVDVNKQKSDIGVKTVLEYLTKEGYSCKNVTSNREEKGYDILAVKGGTSLKIEVKCSSNKKGIPDCFGTEFDDELKIIPDYFYIVRIDEDHKPLKIDILSKREMNEYAHLHKEKRIIKISSKLQTDLYRGRIGKSIVF